MEELNEIRGRSTVGSATEAVAEALRVEIAEGRLTQGSALRQDDLAARFGTSRIPIREALRTLQAEGLVTYSPNRGAVVTIVTAREIQEMLEVRIALECHAIQIAVPLTACSDIEKMRSILDAYDVEPDPSAWSAMNWQFHWALYTPSDCRRLLEAIEQNWKRFSSAARVQISTLAGRERPQREHHQILKFVERGDASGAAALLEEHIRDTQRSIRAKMR